MMHIINEQHPKLLLMATKGMGTSPKFARTKINLSLVELNHTSASAQPKAWLSDNIFKLIRKTGQALTAPHYREHHKAL